MSASSTGARERRIDRVRLPLKLDVAQQPVGALDAVAQVHGATQAAPDSDGRHPRPDHTGGDCLKQGAQTPTMHLVQQRLEATV
jgi:hypothetical protein